MKLVDCWSHYRTVYETLLFVLFVILFQAMSQKTNDQISSLKEEHEKAVAKLQQEVTTLKSTVDAKTEEVNEKNKTLNQVCSLP